MHKIFVLKGGDGIGHLYLYPIRTQTARRRLALINIFVQSRFELSGDYFLESLWHEDASSANGEAGPASRACSDHRHRCR